jgi:hypothetical protein
VQNFQHSKISNGFHVLIKVKLSLSPAVEAHRVEMSRLPHFLDNQLTDGGKVVSLMRRPPFTTRKIPGTHFC